MLDALIVQYVHLNQFSTNDKHCLKTSQSLRSVLYIVFAVSPKTYKRLNETRDLFCIMQCLGLNRYLTIKTYFSTITLLI